MSKKLNANSILLWIYLISHPFTLIPHKLHRELQQLEKTFINSHKHKQNKNTHTFTKHKSVCVENEE